MESASEAARQLLELELQERHDEAREKIGAFMTQFPSSFELRIHLLILAEQEAQQKEAIKELKKLAANEVESTLAQFYELSTSANDSKMVLAFIEDAAKKFPDNNQILLELGACLLQFTSEFIRTETIRKVEQIVDALEKRKTKDNLALARALFLQNLLYPRDLELRLRLTTRIVELYPKYVSAIAIRASILFIASQEKFSFSELDKIYSFNPRYPVASRKANLLAQAGRKEEAITLLQNSIEHDKPAISNVHTLFSLLATLDKDMQIRMVTSGNKVIKNMVGFEHPDLSLLLPSIHHFFGNWDLCIECCTESLSGRKNADKEMLKRLRTQCKRMKHALKLFQPLEKLIPNTAPYYSQHPTISQFIRNLDISATISSQQFDENWESFVTCIAYISHSQTLDGNCVPIDLLKYRVKLTADFIQQVYKSENRTNLMRGSCHSHIVADWLEKFQKKGAGAIIFSTAYTKEQALHVADALKQKIPLSTYLLKNHYY